MLVDEDVPADSALSTEVPLAIPRAPCKAPEASKAHTLPTHKALHVVGLDPWLQASVRARKTLGRVGVSPINLRRPAPAPFHALDVGLGRPSRRLAKLKNVVGELQ